MDIAVVANLIKEAQDKSALEHQERQIALTAWKKAAAEALRSRIGNEMWEALFPFMVVEYQSNHHSGNYLTAFYHVEAVPLQLAPFMFIVKDGGKITAAYRDFTLNVGFEGYSNRVMDDLGNVLAEARVKFPAWHKEQVEKLSREPISRLSNFGFPDNPATEEQADAIYQQLCEIDPDSVERWQTLRAKWAEIKAYRLKQEAEEKAARTAKEQAFADYEAAWLAYARKGLAVLAGNRAKCQELQEKLNGLCAYWALTYAVATEDEDGEKAVETREVNVFQAEASANGYWAVVDRGRLTLQRFYHLVKISEAKTANTFEGPFDVIGTWTPRFSGGFHLHFLPGVDMKQAEESLGLTPFEDEFPTMPDVQYGWEYEAVDAIRQRVPATLEGEGYDSNNIRTILRGNI